jgi:spore maturation protein CgeB
MKVLIIGSNSVFAIENFYARYMKQSGIVVDHYAAQQAFYNYYNQGYIQKLLFRFGLSSIYQQINNAILQKAELFKPDIVWVFKGMEIYPQTLQALRKAGIKLVNYNPDNPFIFTGRGSGNKNVINSISLYDLHFSYNHEIKEKLITDYKVPVKDLPFGFDISQELYNDCKQTTEIVKPCFLGNPDEQRVSFLEKIAHKVPLDVYGNNWERFTKHPNITIFPEVSGLEFWKTLRKYRVQINLLRIHNEDSHNMRTFEVPAIGGIMLAPATKEHKGFFENEKEVFLYNNIEDCILLLYKIMAMEVSESEEIRKSARTASLQKGYSYESRCTDVIEAFHCL